MTVAPDPERLASRFRPGTLTTIRSPSPRAIIAVLVPRELEKKSKTEEWR